MHGLNLSRNPSCEREREYKRGSFDSLSLSCSLQLIIHSAVNPFFPLRSLQAIAAKEYVYELCPYNKINLLNSSPSHLITFARSLY